MALILDGTNTPTLGGVGYGDGTELAFSAAGSAGGVLYSAGGAAPVFSAAGTAGQVLTSAGASAPTWAAVPGPTIVAPVATTSGTTVTFTGIPAGITTLIVYLNGVTNGAGGYYLTIGTSSGLETSGYLAGNVRLTNNDTIAGTQITSYFPIAVAGVATNTGSVTLTLSNSTTNSWALSGAIYNAQANATVAVSAGAKSLSGVLDRVSFVSGNAFTAGQVSIAYK